MLTRRLDLTLLATVVVGGLFSITVTVGDEKLSPSSIPSEDVRHTLDAMTTA